MKDTLVSATDLLAWARQVKDETGLDDVEDELRDAAADPDADIIAAIKWVHAKGTGDCCTAQRYYVCPYHGGWQDALDELMDRLP